MSSKLTENSDIITIRSHYPEYIIRPPILENKLVSHTFAKT